MADNNLNFKILIDDSEFNKKVASVRSVAEKLNTQLSNLLELQNKISRVQSNTSADAARVSSAKEEAILAERLLQAKERTRREALAAAVQEERLKKAMTDTAAAAETLDAASKSKERATASAAAAQQRLATETQKTALATQRVNTETQKTAKATAQAALAQERLNRLIRKSGDAVKQSNGFWGTFKSNLSSSLNLASQLAGVMGSAFSLQALFRFSKQLVTITGEFEAQQMAMRSIIGDLDGADRLVDRLKSLAIESPYTFKEITGYAKQLSAFSIPLDEMYDTVKMLADVSAGVGVDMSRIILAYGQVRSAEFLRGQEVRQFTEAGIPILEQLARQFSDIEGKAVSVGEVFDRISSREVPFAMVKQAFIDMTSEGGKFNDMQKVLVDTLAGRIGKLKDSFEMALNDIGSRNSGFLKGVVDSATDIVTHYERIGNEIKALVLAYGTYKTTLGIVSLAQKTAALHAAGHWKQVNFVRLAFIKLGKAMHGVWAMLVSNPWALLAAAIAATTYAIVKFTTHVSDAGRVVKAVDDAIRDSESSIRTESSLIERYTTRLTALEKSEKDLTEQLAKGNLTQEENRELTEKLNIVKTEHDGILKSLDTKYGSYIQHLKDEGTWTENNTKNYELLAAAIAKSTKSRMYEKAWNRLNEETEAGIDKLSKNVESAIRNILPRNRLDIAEAFWSAVLGDGDFAALNEKLDEFNYTYVVRNNIIGVARRYNRQYSEIVAANVEGGQKIEAYFGEKKKEHEADGGLVGVWLPDPDNYVSDWVRRVRKVLSQNAEAATKDAANALGLGTLWAEQDTDRKEYFDALKKDYKELKEKYSGYGTAFSEDEKRKMKANLDVMESLAEEFGFDLEDKKKGKKTNPFQSWIDDLEHFVEKYKEYMKLITEEGWNDAPAKKRAFGSSWSGTTDPETYVNALFRKALSNQDISLDLSLMGGPIKEQLEAFVKDGSVWNNLEKLITEAEALRETRMDEYKSKWAEAEKYEKKAEKSVEEQIADLRVLMKLVDGNGEWTDDKRKAVISGIAAEIGKLVGSLKDVESIDLTPLWSILDAMQDVAVGDNYRNFADDIRAGISLVKDKGSKSVTKRGQVTYTLSFDTPELSEEEKDLFRKMFGSVDEVTMTGKQFKTLMDNLDKFRDKNASEKNRWGLFGIIPAVKDIAQARKELNEALSSGDSDGIASTANKEKAAIDRLTKSMQEWMNAADAMGKALASFGGAFGEIGEAISAFSSSGSGLQTVMNSITKGEDRKWSITDKGALIGTAIQSTLEMASMIGDQIEENKRKTKEWEATMAECAHELKMMRLEQLEYSESNIFGVENPYKKAIDNAYLYAESIKELMVLQEELANGRVKVKLKNALSGKNIGKGTGIGAVGGASVGTIIAPGIGTAIGAAAGAIVGAITGMFGAKKKKTVWASIADNYDYLYDDETYELNPKIIADYKKLDDTTKRIVDNWEEIRKKAQQAEADMRATFQDLAGNIGTDLSDALVEAFRNKDIYSAIDVFHNKMTGTIEDIMSKLIFSSVFGDMLDGLGEDFENSFKQGGDQDIVDDLMRFENGWADGLEMYYAKMEDVRKWLEEKGYFDAFKPTDGTTNLKDNIQSITEDTANLLASYVNAIRADVSVANIKRDDMLAILRNMGAPKLQDYLNQIQANTYDSAQSTKEILTQIKRVITPMEGGALKVTQI